MDRREWLGDNQETFIASSEGLQSGLWTALPAIVVSVDLEKQTISAQSSIIGQYTDEQGLVHQIEMPIFDDVVLCFPRGGGYAITFPVQPGDEVLIMFASRCIDGWWQSGGKNNVPPDLRMHDLSDSFAILAPTSQPKKLSGVSETAFRIMSEDSNRYIEIDNNDIKINSNLDVIVESGRDVTVESGRDVIINVDRNITVNAAGNIDINSTGSNKKVNITSLGNNGDINIEADMRIDITAQDIYLNGTVH